MKTNPHVGMTFEECYTKYKRIIKLIAKKNIRRINGVGAIGKEDIEQIAVIGFIKAYQKFDKTNSTQFGQFAKQMMKWEILNTLRDTRTTISFPQSFGVIWSIASKRGLTIHNLPEIIKLKPKKYSDAQVKRAMEWYGNEVPMSLDKSVSNNTNDNTNDKNGYDIIKGTENDESKTIVIEFLTKLTTKQKQVAKYLMDGKTQSEIAKLMDISQPQVCRIIKSLQKSWNIYEGCGK